MSLRPKRSPMKKASKRRDPDLSPEYDFSKGVRGKYAKRYADGTNVILLEPDLMEYFPDSKSVNTALRTIVELGKPKTRSDC